MGKKREILRECRQVRLLIEENKYTKALEQIDGLPLEEIESLDDLYLFAELYEKAGRIEKKKQILYLIYEKTHFRHVLEKLLRLAIQLGDMEEARELYFSYEVGGAVTLDTFELRYLLAKAEGEPRSRLIEILEDLKKEEYTEEWGYQLACLYEEEGEREKCIRECKELKLWFGEGKIVDQAMELQKRCESPETEESMQKNGLSEDLKIEETEKTEQEEAETAEAAEAEVKPEMQTAEAVETEVKPETQTAETAEAGVKPETQTAEAVEAEEKPETQKAEAAEDEEEPEDISRHGIHYRTFKSAMYHVRRDHQETPHFIFAGGESKINQAVAKRLTKELSKNGHIKTRTIGKIAADKLNQVDVSAQMKKIAGGCMLVTDASELRKDTVKALVKVLDRKEPNVVVMLTGPFDEMDCFLDAYPKLAEKFTYKVKM